MRARRRVVLFLCLLLLFTSTSIASAQGILDGEQCHVEADTVVRGNLFVLCGDLLVEGVVEGNIIGAARAATITGTVEGSLYILGVEMEVSGQLGKDIHFAGLALNVADSTFFENDRGSVLSASLSSTLHEGTVVPGHVTNVGYQLIVDGTVGGEINFWGSALQISGAVSQDITATVGNSESDGSSDQIETLLIPFQINPELVDPGLIIAESGQVDGQVDYTAANPGQIDGTTARPPIFRSTQDPILDGTPVEQSARSLGRYFRVVLREFFSLGLIGVLCVVFFPRYIQSPTRIVRLHPLSSMGVGMLSFILSFPIVLIVVILSAVIVLILSLLPLNSLVIFTGLVLGLANVGFASVFYFVAIYIARIVVALAIGRVLTRLVFRDRDDGSWRYIMLSMIVGVLLLSAMGAIPVIGWGFNALALFLGLGGILSVVREGIARLGTPPAPAPAAPPSNSTPGSVPRLPYLLDDTSRFPAIVEDEEESPSPPGTENLPDGFNWWRSNHDDS